MTQATHDKFLADFRKKYGKSTPKPQPVRPLNPMSDYWYGTDRCEGEARLAKIAYFSSDKHEKQAIAEDGTKITLGDDGATEDLVDLIGGIWHIQNNFDYSKIVRVRDKDMILMDKLSRKEDNRFEYWNAKHVGYNCFGPFVSKTKDADYIVAKYETDDGPFWGYGKTLEEARAYLGLKLFDEYKDIIHVIACRNKSRKK